MAAVDDRDMRVRWVSLRQAGTISAGTLDMLIAVQQYRRLLSEALEVVTDCAEIGAPDHELLPLMQSLTACRPLRPRDLLAAFAPNSTSTALAIETVSRQYNCPALAPWLYLRDQEKELLSSSNPAQVVEVGPNAFLPTSLSEVGLSNDTISRYLAHREDCVPKWCIEDFAHHPDCPTYHHLDCDVYMQNYSSWDECDEGYCEGVTSFGKPTWEDQSLPEGLKCQTPFSQHPATTQEQQPVTPQQSDPDSARSFEQHDECSLEGVKSHGGTSSSAEDDTPPGLNSSETTLTPSTAPTAQQPVVPRQTDSKCHEGNSEQEPQQATTSVQKLACPFFEADLDAGRRPSRSSGTQAYQSPGYNRDYNVEPLTDNRKTLKNINTDLRTMTIVPDDIDSTLFAGLSQRDLERLARNFNAVGAWIFGEVYRSRYSSPMWQLSFEEKRRIATPGLVFKMPVFEQLMDSEVAIDDLNRMNGIHGLVIAKDRFCILLELRGETIRFLSGTAFGDKGRPPAHKKSEYFRLAHENESIDAADAVDFSVVRFTSKSNPLTKPTYVHFTEVKQAHIRLTPFAKEGTLTVGGFRIFADLVQLDKQHPFRLQ